MIHIFLKIEVKSHNKTSPFKVKNSMAFNTSCFCCSVTNSCPVLCKSMDCSMPGSSVLHYHPICSNSCPLSQWGHPTISFSVTLFSFCLQSFPAVESFLKSQLFTSSGQRIGASASVLPMNIQDWLPLGIEWFDLAVQRTLRSLLQHHSWKASILQC